MNMMSSENLSDFSAQWCQDLLTSPDAINTSTKTRLPSPPADRVVTNTLFSETFKTNTTIRAWQTLRAKHIQLPDISPVFYLLLSLGTGLDSYRGILHGGMFGVIMDQACSICAINTAGPTAVTAEMTLRYRRSVPLPGVVLCRTVVTKTEGRKLCIRGTIEDGAGLVCCEADSLFVLGRQEKI